MSKTFDAVFIYFNVVQGIISGAEYQLDSSYIRCYLKKKGLSTLQYINKNINRYKDAILDLNNIPTSKYIFYINEYNYYFSRLIINQLKSINSLSKIIIIGPSAKYIFDTLRNDVKADIYVFSHSAFPLYDILYCNKSLHLVNNIGYCENNLYLETAESDFKYSLDDLGLPYSEQIIPVEEIQNVGLISSTGCYGKCSFCSYIKNSGRFKVHSVENVINELEYIKQFLHGRNVSVSFFDDCFSISPKRTFEICKEIISRKINFKFWCCTRADLLSEELIDIMAESNFKNIVIGLETASTHILNKLGKVTLNDTAAEYIEKVRSMYEYAKNKNINPVLSVNFGLPFEQLDDAFETVEFLRKNKINNVSICYMSSFPGSQVFHFSDTYDVLKKASPVNLPYRTYYKNYDARKIYGRLIDSELLSSTGSEFIINKQRIASQMYSFVTGLFEDVDLYNSIKYIKTDNYNKEEMLFIDENIDLNGIVISQKEKLKIANNYLFSDDRKRLKFEIKEYDNNLFSSYQANQYLPNQLFIKPTESGYLLQYENLFNKSPIHFKIKKLQNIVELNSLCNKAKEIFAGEFIDIQDIKDDIIENACSFCGRCKVCAIPRVSIEGNELMACIERGKIGQIGDSYTDLISNIRHKLDERDEKRGCYECFANKWCSKCLFPPGFMSDDEYCKFIRLNPSLSIYLNMIDHFKPLFVNELSVKNIKLKLYRYNSALNKGNKDKYIPQKDVFLIVLNDIIFIANLESGFIRRVLDNEKSIIMSIFGLKNVDLDKFSQLDKAINNLRKDSFLETNSTF